MLTWRGPRDHVEPGAVRVTGLDPVCEDLEAVDRRNPGGGDRSRAPLAALGDLLRRTGRVVGGLDRPWAGPEELVRLGERRGDRVDALDGVEPLARQREQGQAHGHRDLAGDREVELVQQVQVLADGPQQGALDRDDARVGLAIAHRLEHGPERRERHRLGRGEEPEHGLLGEGAGLARVGDTERGRVAPRRDRRGRLARPGRLARCGHGRRPRVTCTETGIA
jgi:hypothetical protein